MRLGFPVSRTTEACCVEVTLVGETNIKAKIPDESNKSQLTNDEPTLMVAVPLRTQKWGARLERSIFYDLHHCSLYAGTIRRRDRLQRSGG